MSDVLVGSVFPVNGGGFATVINYINSRNVVIEHNDAHKLRSVVRADNLRRGKVKNPYKPNIYGVGFIGVGDFKCSENGRMTHEYCTWVGVLERVYSDKFHKKNPTYKGCTIDPSWHSFQVFAKWYTESEYSELNYHLDKDLIKKDNKRYCPEFCTLVPREINNLINNRLAARGGCPIGVSYRKGFGNYIASLNVDGKSSYLGVFDSPEEAHLVYVQAKESYVKNKALEWQEKIDKRVFDALMAWTVV